jgi:predicted ArsR family transcriptional regulator
LSFPSVETISNKSGISAVQVKRCLKILEETGYISKERAGKNNVYRPLLAVRQLGAISHMKPPPV